MKSKRPSSYALLLLCFTVVAAGLPQTQAQPNRQATGGATAVSLDSLAAGKSVGGFRVEAVYLNDADRPLGARFVHERTGFTLDLLQIQSVPQGYLWVNSFPTSDMGEPHTQEHLLLGKGNKGRAVASLEDMSLAGSNAFTQQLRTSYHFHTAAGPEVFYKLLESQVDALLHPDYTEEEIRREVRNFGVTENPANKTLGLEEKGSVYNEMVSSMDRPNSRLFRAIGTSLYGAGHPLQFNSGGLPSAIREMQPEHIRKFHRENYHLGNMGLIASLPQEMAVGDVLARMDAMLVRLEPDGGRKSFKFKSEADLPAPKSAPAGQIQIVDYPHKNEQQPGLVLFAWPPTQRLDLREITLLDLFLDNIASDATTNLYKKFVDTKTREMETGAKGVFSGLQDYPGNPLYIGLSDVSPAHMNEAQLAAMRSKIQEEIARIAAFKDGSPELAEFNARVASRVIQARRELAKFVNSPPGFGFRSIGSGWMDQLKRLEMSKDFRKSVTMKPELDAVEKLLAGNQNFWRDYIAKWKLAETVPYAAAARPNPALIRQEEQERQARAAAEVARLKTLYKVTDEQEAIRRYKADYDKMTDELDRIAKQVAPPRFVESPPLTLDDQLDFKVTKLASDVPMVASTFENMTSATTGVALRLDAVPEDKLFYLSALPLLLRSTGVVRDGRALSFEEMSEAIRKEILQLNVFYSTNFRTNRAELVVRGAGNDTAESRRAVEWMRLVLTSPNWRVENLPRMRDAVDQSLSGTRGVMQGAEEAWVNNPANAYRRQDNPLLLATSSFLTQVHNLHRLRWLLKDAGDAATRTAIEGFLARLGDAAGGGRTRADLKALLGAMQGNKEFVGKVPAALAPYAEAFAALPAGAKTFAVEAAKDLEQSLADIPDETLAQDWAYLSAQMRRDLLVSPETVIADLNALRQSLLKTGGARMFVIGSTATQKSLEPEINGLLATLAKAPHRPVAYSELPLVKTRMRPRTPDAPSPIFVGLVNPNTQGGVFLNSAPGATYVDTDRESLLQFLASKLYAGGGAHGIFMKTWGAGLAYSNGLGGSPSTGRQSYYAERTPELPQTLRFVIDELKKAPRDPGLVEYAVAQAFTEFRSASPYEARGEAMAADLADGLTPDMVRDFRRAILSLRSTPNLSEELYNRMGKVYARVLPGYEGRMRDVTGGIYFVIGPEKQFNAYEGYLKTVEGADARLFRIYPRDFWMTATDVAAPAAENRQGSR
jgi:Zn-dependent M16 (insulinase) family peptidase